MSRVREILQTNRSFWKNPFVIVVSVVLLYLVSQIVGALVVAPFFTLLPNQNIRLCLIFVAALVALYGMLSTAITVLGFKWSDIGIRFTKLRAIFAVVPAFILYAFVSTYLTNLAIKFIPGFDVDQVQNIGMIKTGTVNVVVAFISLVILTPLYEELIFRGVLFSGLRKRLPFIVSAIIASVVFGIAHMQLNLAVDTFALSMFLCVFVEKTKSIVPGIALHALKNFIAFGVLFLGWSIK